MVPPQMACRTGMVDQSLQPFRHRHMGRLRAGTICNRPFGQLRRPSLLIRLTGKSSKVALGILIAANIATLATFKYANFFGSNLHALTGWIIAAFPLGIPIAISFYTFHIISYLVDVRAGKIRHAGFRQYLFYLSFFPHVVAGPIVRGWQLLPQIGHVRKVRTDLFMGFHFFVVGFFLKIITFPISILTLGIFLLVINGLMILVASNMVRGFHVRGFGPAFWGAVVLALLGMLIRAVAKSA